MHHPPAPVLGNGQVGVLAPHQAGGVEKGDGNRRDQEHAQQVAALHLVLKRRPDGADHQEQPQEQAHQQEYLPETAQVHVLIALVPEPEVLGVAQFLHHAIPLPGQRTEPQ